MSNMRNGIEQFEPKPAWLMGPGFFGPRVPDKEFRFHGAGEIAEKLLACINRKGARGKPS
jgi:hypothetical protein